MRPLLFKNGIKYDEFYSHTFGELLELFNVYLEIENDNRKDEAYSVYNLANLIGISVGRLMSKDNKYPKIEEVFPHLFVEEAKAKKEKDVDYRDSQIKMMALADMVNAERRRKKESEVD